MMLFEDSFLIIHEMHFKSHSTAQGFVGDGAVFQENLHVETAITFDVTLTGDRTFRKILKVQ